MVHKMRSHANSHSTGYQGGTKKAEVEVEAKKFLNLNLDLNLLFSR
ncbi:MAG: hypothetical protein AAB014_05025 [Nitrospirota bacterium]